MIKEYLDLINTNRHKKTEQAKQNLRIVVSKRATNRREFSRLFSEHSEQNRIESNLTFGTERKKN